MSLEVQVSPKVQRVSLRDQVMGNEVLVSELLFHYHSDAQEGQMALPIREDYSYSVQGRFLRSRDQSRPFHLITANVPDFDYLAALWDMITPMPAKEEAVIEALQIIEPTVEDIRFPSRQTAARILVKLHGQPDRVPLSSMGDGMRRI